MEQELQCIHIRQGQPAASLMKEMSGIKSRLHQFATKSLRMHRISSRTKCQRLDCETDEKLGVLRHEDEGISNATIPVFSITFCMKHLARLSQNDNNGGFISQRGGVLYDN